MPCYFLHALRSIRSSRSIITIAGLWFHSEPGSCISSANPGNLSTNWTLSFFFFWSSCFSWRYETFRRGRGIFRVSREREREREREPAREFRGEKRSEKCVSRSAENCQHPFEPFTYHAIDMSFHQVTNVPCFFSSFLFLNSLLSDHPCLLTIFDLYVHELYSHLLNC